ncbi:adenine deaminase [Desulforamulus aeronauticus]|uniref:Adenine deaminase n=1 Tax=Desulforamulus aeronauticus DSM 10349 TaxID=1121421 RepID=A0A1M6RAG1_9FIRM|nr:adenine deaminase [Desulforamulus aeronauticus]SHK29410.1 Adenine deaminase [Desulforamulus aeronauticus DSM 10349]
MKKRYSLAEVTQELAFVAMGRKPAEVVLKNGRLVNVNTGEIMPNMDIAITHGRIALVGDASHTIGEGTQVIDCQGNYLTPGFMDGHIHVESSMMTVREYARSVVPRGTTTIYMDPHEIANVLGMDGIKLMIEDGKQVPLRVYVAMPSCVPATPAFEDAGAVLGPDEIREAMQWEAVAGLGEMMNFPGVMYGDPSIHAELQATLGANKTITGHFSIPETGQGLNAYVSTGIRCCHESVRAEDALAKMRLGMYAQLREGSAWHDVKETIKSITENRIDSRYATLVSDDTHPNTLLSLGHLDHIVKRAIEEGVNPVTAIQMVTINVAQCFSMDRDLGSISPGRWADILLISDLTKVKVEKVLVNGELVAAGGRMLVDLPPVTYPEFARQSMHLAAPLKPEDFIVSTSNPETTKVQVRVMEIMEAKVGTLARECLLPVQQGEVEIDLAQDIIKVAVIERHKATGTMGKGFVKGFHLKAGAVASTVAHDSHNLLVVGTNDNDMALAGNKLVEVGGGMVAVRDGQVIALLPLPIAGLMSDQSVEQVAELVEELDQAWKKLGCHLISPFMTMALLPLAVLPELRLTNRGLVDTVNFQFIDLIVSEQV